MEGSTVLATAALSNGQVQFTTSALMPGTQSISALYGGDTNFSPSVAALTQTVNPVPSTITLTSSLNPSGYGQAVTLTAIVTPDSPGAGILTGRVGFREGLTTLGVAYIDASGRATVTFPGTDAYGTPLAALSPGNHTFTAYYWGDPIFGEVTSAPLTQTVKPVSTVSTTTTLTSPVNPSAYGQAVTFTAAVTPNSPGGGTPTGTVTFKDGATVLATGTLNTSAIATYSTSALGAGNHSITAVYNGDTNDQGSSSSTLPQTVIQASTTTRLTSSRNPSVYGQAVTITATVAAVSPGGGTPTGTVTFKDGATVLGIGALDAGGRATFTTSSLRVGNHSITAVYSGNTNFSVSTSTVLTQAVNRAGTAAALSSSANPSVHGQAVSFTATVAAVSPGGGTPTGTVTFKDGTAILGTGALGAGTARFTTSSLRVGRHSITAVYSGDTNFSVSTSTVLTQTVNPESTATGLTSSANPSVYGRRVTFTATVAGVSPGGGTPTGTVIFKDGATILGTRAPDAGGRATFTTSSLRVGRRPITAVYEGSTNYRASTSARLTQRVSRSRSPATRLSAR